METQGLILSYPYPISYKATKAAGDQGKEALVPLYLEEPWQSQWVFSMKGVTKAVPTKELVLN